MAKQHRSAKNHSGETLDTDNPLAEQMEKDLEVVLADNSQAQTEKPSRDSSSRVTRRKAPADPE